MSYFPAFISMYDKKVLIIGAGNIAHEKLERLLDFTTEITVIASAFSDAMSMTIQKHGLQFFTRNYNTGDIQGFDMVIIAVDDLDLQAEIYEEARQYRCLCNAVDSVKYCDFIFPSYVKEGDLTLAISTSGASPAMAKQLRLYLGKCLPKDIASFLVSMKELRRTLPKGIQRMKLLEEKAKEYMSRLNK